jgi:hypothetical protein
MASGTFGLEGFAGLYIHILRLFAMFSLPTKRDISQAEGKSGFFRRAFGAERSGSAAPGSGSAADTVGRRLHSVDTY